MDSQEFLDLRKAMKLKQKALAGRLGVTQGTIAKYEKRVGGVPEPTARLLRRIYREWKTYCIGALNIQFIPCGQFHYNMAHWISLSDVDHLNNETWGAYYEEKL